MAMLDEVKAGKDLYAHFDTTEGKVVVKLFTKDAPKTVENFVGLATGEKEWTDPASGAKKTGVPLYDGTLFHRCIGDFMIQGGDPLGRGTGGPGYKFADEFQSGRKFDKPGLLAMANSGPNTNGTSSSSPWCPRPGSPTSTPSSARWCRATTTSSASPTTSPRVRRIARRPTSASRS